MTDEETDGEETVMLTRRDRRSRGSAEAAGAPVDEATVAVARPSRRLRRKRAEGSAVPEATPAATGIPIGPISFEAPTDAPAPAIYRPRAAPRGPSAPPVVVGAAAPTRAADPDLPSVAKQGLRWSKLALIACSAACIVSFAGLVALGFLVFA